MNLALTPEQLQFKESIDRVVADRSGSWRQHTGAFNRALWLEVADLGWLGAGLPEAHGGFGGGAIETMLIMEAVGRSLVHAPFLPCMVHAVRLLLGSGRGGESIPEILAGKCLVTVALDESRVALSDCETVLSRGSAGYVLSGRKQFVLYGVDADSYLVTANFDQAPAIVKVSSTAPGIRATGYPSIDRHDRADVSFEETPVSPDAVLGIGDHAESTLAYAERHATAALCAEAVGIAQFLLDETLTYVKVRKQFGQPIGRFQAIQHRIVDMYVAVEEARSLSLMAAVNLESPDLRQRAHAVAAAKMGVLSRALHVARESIQLHGGIGMTEDLALGAGLRRLTAMKSTYGDEAAQLDRMVPGILSGIYTAYQQLVNEASGLE